MTPRSGRPSLAPGGRFQVERHGPVTRLRMARTAGGRVLHEVSAYLAGGLLIDTGPPPTAAALVDFCRRRPPERVILTHHHEDHVGGAAALAASLGLAIEAPAPALPLLAAGLRMPLYRRVIWRCPAPLRALPLPERVEAGGLRLRVIATPGHAFDHVCFFEEDRRWLFAGDLFVHERVRLLRRIEDVREHLRSLVRVLALDPQRLFCAHAGVVADARGALGRKIAFWEELGERAAELARRGFSPGSVSRRLLGREPLMTYLSLGDFSHRNLIASLLGRSGSRRASGRRSPATASAGTAGGPGYHPDG